MRIHPTAVVDPAAVLGSDVQIGPLSVIEGDVVIGEGCQILHHVVIRNGTTMGPGNTVCEGAVLGGLPQHVHVPEKPGRLVIGSGNTFRENVTFHRAMAEGSATVIGDNNLFMVNTHVVHDCRVGNHTIFANNSMLAGHVTVGDRAFFSGAAAAHQFCRIGTLAMVGGQAHINKDVPPFVTLDGLSSHVVGLNTIGLRCAGLKSDDILQLKQAYKIIYRSALAWNEILQRLQDDFREGYAAQFYPFLSATTRGIMTERRMPPGAIVRLRNEEEAEPRLRTRRLTPLSQGMPPRAETREASTGAAVRPPWSLYEKPHRAASARCGDDWLRRLCGGAAAYPMTGSSARAASIRSVG